MALVPFSNVARKEVKLRRVEICDCQAKLRVAYGN